MTSKVVITHKGRVLQCSNVIDRTPRRNENIEDGPVNLDFSRAPRDLCNEMLLSSVALNSNDLLISKATKLSNLNRFVKLIMKFPPNKHDYGLSLNQLLLCTSSLLVDQEREVRAAALRVVRYLIKTPADLSILFQLNIDVLIVRCLDTVLDNASERMQCLRLIGHLIQVDANSIPDTIIRCLHSLSKLDLHDHDRMSKASTSLLCEIITMRPNVILLLKDTTWLVRTILAATNERIIECLIGLICRLVNFPRYREKLLFDGRNIFQVETYSAQPSNGLQIMLPFQELFAPLSDPHFTLSSGEKDDYGICYRDEQLMVLENSKAAFRYTLRNWCGIISCFVSHSCDGRQANDFQSPLKIIVDSFCYLPFNLQESFVDCLLEVLNIEAGHDPRDEKVSRSECELLNADVLHIVNEFGRKSHYGLNLPAQVNVAIVSELVNCGLFQVFLKFLVERKEKTGLEEKILVLMSYTNSELYDLLPRSCQAILQVDFGTLREKTAPGEAKLQQNAKNAVVELLRRANLHTGEFAKQDIKSISFSRMLDRLMSSPLTNDHRNIQDVIGDSKVLFASFEQWDCSKIRCALLMLSADHSCFQDEAVSNFIAVLVDFYNTKTGQFFKLEHNDDVRLFARLGCILLKIISTIPACSLFLSTFLDQLQNVLSASTIRLGSQLASNPASVAFYLFVGEMSFCDNSLKLLSGCGVISRLLAIVESRETADNELLAEVIISCLDYSKSIEVRSVLKAALKSPNKRLRIYAIRFLHCLMILNVPNMAEFCIEELIDRLTDQSPQKALLVAQILHQLALKEANRKIISQKKSNLYDLGDHTVLFRCYYCYDERYLLEHQKIDQEVLHWKDEFNLRYVDIVDDCLISYLTNCQLSPIGNFLRPSDEQKVGTFFLPPHLYGALAKTATGRSILRKYSCLNDALRILMTTEYYNDATIKQTKAAIWCIGHIMTGPYFKSDQKRTITLRLLLTIYSRHEIWSIRSTAFHALNLTCKFSDEIYRTALSDFVWPRTFFDIDANLHLTKEGRSSLHKLDRTLSANNFYLNGATLVKPLRKIVSLHMVSRLDAAAWRTQDSFNRVMSCPCKLTLQRKWDPKVHDDVIYNGYIQDEMDQIYFATCDEPEDEEYTNKTRKDYSAKYYGISEHNKALCFQCSKNDSFSYQNMSSSEHRTLNDCIRLICLISIRRQYAEQGLLKIKQEMPQIFQSVCFYSDICDFLRKYEFTLNARHFIQELFYDASGLPKLLQNSAQDILVASNSSSKMMD